MMERNGLDKNGLKDCYLQWYCLPSPILSSSCGHLGFFLLRGLQLLSFPNPAGDPRAQISKLADLSYMLREGVALKGDWLSPDELGFFVGFFLLLLLLILFGEVRAGMVPDQNEQTSWHQGPWRINTFLKNKKIINAFLIFPTPASLSCLWSPSLEFCLKFSEKDTA